MKKQALSFLGVLGLLALLVAESAHAQTIHVRANVPFDFSVNREILPAGHYEVRTISSATGQALVINNSQGKISRMFLTNFVNRSAADAGKTKLVFRRYGQQYFLSQVWVAGNDTGRELPKSAREMELARAIEPAKAVVMADLH
jgi:hypothetical protein